MATTEDLIVLSTLETINVYLLNQEVDKKTRIQKLVGQAKQNFQIIQNQRSAQQIRKLGNSLNFE